MRTFMLSGDWIPLTLPAALRRLAPAARVMSLGGATEGAIWSIRHPVTDADCAGRSIPYGTALPGQDIHVLDAERRLCPDWHIGEICIGGAGVADGYVNDPEKTAAAFVDHPVFGRIYRTGDRGRRHPDGVVEFLGRTDTQVKLNGHRVELGEVEHLLDRLPGVRGSAACVRGEGRRKSLVAYVTLAEDPPGTWQRDAYAALGKALPHYMVPDAVVALDEIPLTGNGKVDRRRLQSLPLPDDERADAEPAVPAGDPLGQEIAGCWREVLGEPPGRRGFFEAGGSSYDAIRLLSLVRGRLGHEVSFGDFMADPTVAGLASLCRRVRGERGSGIWTYRPRAAVRPRLRLVLFPPVGGGVSCYAGLIRELPGDIDVHVAGFDAPVARSGPAVSLTGLARGCLRELPAEVLSGDGPLVFAGWSFRARWPSKRHGSAGCRWPGSWWSTPRSPPRPVPTATPGTMPCSRGSSGTSGRPAGRTSTGPTWPRIRRCAPGSRCTGRTSRRWPPGVRDRPPCPSWSSGPVSSRPSGTPAPGAGWRGPPVRPC
ncbi:AMP-binding protein [Streptomyces diastatochromogenes]|nr:AMP-binding protein [Streptomyces diastatochromogenes]